MSFSLIYLLQRFFYRIWMFIYDWYVGGFIAIGGKVVSFLEKMDRTWAFRINLRNLFKPLYQDQTLIGRLLGFVLRSARLILAGALYTLIIILGAGIYILWAGIPIYVIDKGFLR